MSFPGKSIDELVQEPDEGDEEETNGHGDEDKNGDNDESVNENSTKNKGRYTVALAFSQLKQKEHAHKRMRDVFYFLLPQCWIHERAVLMLRCRRFNLIQLKLCKNWKI